MAEYFDANDEITDEEGHIERRLLEFEGDKCAGCGEKFIKWTTARGRVRTPRCSYGNNGEHYCLDCLNVYVADDAKEARMNREEEDNSNN